MLEAISSAILKGGGDVAKTSEIAKSSRPSGRRRSSPRPASTGS